MKTLVNAFFLVALGFGLIALSITMPIMVGHALGAFGVFSFATAVAYLVTKLIVRITNH